jgi:hypothetical protein
MIRLFFSTLLLLGGTTLLNAKAYHDSTDHHHKHSNGIHLVGVQANSLVRQIFNFGGNAPNNNPYVLTYGYLNNASKIGLDVGIGYTVNNFFNNDGNTKNETNINDANIRLGVQLRSPLSKRFIATGYFHFIGNLLSSKVKTESSFSGQFTRTNSSAQQIGFGLGPALGLRYRVSNRLFIGTEASYYFMFGNRTTDITTYTEFSGVNGETRISKTDNDFMNFTLNTPTALYLIMRF